jgi:CRP/FNR family transcriptional regulator, anaerobic regulatory protein
MATLSYSPEAASMDAFCAALPLSQGSSKVANQLAQLGNYLRLPRGCALEADWENDRLVYIASGAAKLVAQSVQTGDDSRPHTASNHVLAFHFAGDMVSVLRQKDGDFQLLALGDCDLLVFPTDEFLDVAQGDPVILRSVLTRSLHALHRSRTRMMQMGHKSARQRIADFLVSMAERMGNSSNGACRLILPMSRRDIGDSLGLTIETVSRQFSELREAGLIETQGRSLVRLLDVAALARAAGYQGQTARAVQQI